jgi:hypothetical protein
MTPLRIIIATLVIVLGVLYIYYGVFAILMLVDMGTSAFASFTISESLTLPLGVIAFACGVGLMLARKWSRRLWFITAAFFVLFNSVWIVVDYRAGHEIAPLVPSLVIVAFCLASSLFLKSHAAAHLFS